MDVYATQVSPRASTTLPVVRTEDRYRTWAEIWFGVQQHLRRVFVSLSGTVDERVNSTATGNEPLDMNDGRDQIRHLPAPKAEWAQSAGDEAKEREKSRQTEIGTSLARSDFWSHGSGKLKTKLSALRLRGVEVELREVEPDVWVLLLTTPASKSLAAAAAKRVLRQRGPDPILSRSLEPESDRKSRFLTEISDPSILKNREK